MLPIAILIWIIQLFPFITIIHAETESNITRTNTGHICHLICLAKCVGKENTASLKNGQCESTCKNYNNDQLCNSNDHDCWSKCKDLINDTGNVPVSPENILVNYTVSPHPTPHEADVKWDDVAGANLYLVQYSDGSVRVQKWMENNNSVTFGNSWHFQKPELCHEYEFRVAAVNRYGVSPFSKSVKLSTPTPVIENPSYNLTLIELLHQPFTGIAPNDANYNTSVRIVVSYVPPAGWNLSTDIVRVEPFFHVTELATVQPVAPYIRQIQGTAQFEILLPGDVAYTDGSSGALFGVASIFTRCDPSVQIEYPATNPPFFMLTFNCANVKGGVCPRPRPFSPNCNPIATELQPSFKCINDSLANVTVQFSPIPTNSTAQYYKVAYASVNRYQAGSAVPALYHWQDVTVMDIPADATSFFIADMQLNVYYQASICAIFDNSTEDDIQWNITQPYSIGVQNNVNICTTKSSSSRIVAILVISLAILLLLVFLVLAFLYAKMRRRRTKTLAELAGLEKNGNLDGLGNGYVDMPRLYDRWEIPKSHLTLCDDQKLGSGAFGAVYKGKIRGKALMSKLAQSVLAERWMAAEDCDVAVKMLPEYADEGAKSEFRKEINLMKQLGYHERLVNMLCCITAEEPLCLIVEYCSEGDLLHYLRDRCKYMVKLQEQGIDLMDLPDDHDVDLDYILTMKDLLMFSWQICVGLEYLSEKSYIHRDVAARNVMVDTGKRAKIGDFGLCRYSCSDPIYMGKGGRLPWKWMALEAVKNYEFTTKSDVWSFGVLLFEIITLGGSPYPGIDPSNMEKYLEDGNRLAQPDNCPDQFYGVMLDCWQSIPEKRPSFTELRERLTKQLEDITEDYSYLHLNQHRDYYNMMNNYNSNRQQYPSSLAPIIDDEMDEEDCVASTSFTNPIFQVHPEPSSSHARSAQTRVSVDSSDTISVGSTDGAVEGPHGETAGSKQTLINGNQQQHRNKLQKVFKLKQWSSADRLDELPETTVSSDSTETGAVNPVYLDKCSSDQ